MAKKYVKAYYDWKTKMSGLSDAEKGRLLIFILDYAESGILPDTTGRESAIFPVFQEQVDRDGISYDQRILAAQNGGLAKASKLYQIVANASETCQEKKIERNKDNKTNNPQTPKGGDAFDAFWTSYPKKAAKKDAQKAWGKVKPDSYPAVMDGLERAKGSEQWQKDGGRFVPNAATWLNGERWNDEYTKQRSSNPALKYMQRETVTSPVFESLDDV